MKYPHLYLPREISSITRLVATLANRPIWYVTPKIDGMNIMIEGGYIHLREGGRPDNTLEEAIRSCIPRELLEISSSVTVFCEVCPPRFFKPAYQAFWEKEKCYVLDIYKGRMLPPEDAVRILPPTLKSRYVGNMGIGPITLNEAIPNCRVPEGQEGVVIKAYFPPNLSLPLPEDKNARYRAQEAIGLGMLGIKYKPHESSWNELLLIKGLIGNKIGDAIEIQDTTHVLSANEIASIVWQLLASSPHLGDFTRPQDMMREVKKRAAEEAKQRNAQLREDAVYRAVRQVLARYHGVTEEELEALWKDLPEAQQENGLG